MRIKVNGLPLMALIDTGSSASFINRKVVLDNNIPEKPWQQDVSMANSSFTSTITSACLTTIELNDHKLPNTLLRVMKELCVDVILGQDIFRQYSSLEIKFNEPKPALKLCFK